MLGKAAAPSPARRPAAPSATVRQKALDRPNRLTDDTVMREPMDAYPLLARIAQLLDRHGLEAVLIGNAAAALQGAPVTTVDFDFLIRRTPANVRKLTAIAAELHAVLMKPHYPVSSLLRISRDDDGLQLDFMGEID